MARVDTAQRVVTVWLKGGSEPVPFTVVVQGKSATGAGVELGRGEDSVTGNRSLTVPYGQGDVSAVIVSGTLRGRRFTVALPPHEHHVHHPPKRAGKPEVAGAAASRLKGGVTPAVAIRDARPCHDFPIQPLCIEIDGPPPNGHGHCMSPL